MDKKHKISDTIKRCDEFIRDERYSYLTWGAWLAAIISIIIAASVQNADKNTTTTRPTINTTNIKPSQTNAFTYWQQNNRQK